VLRGLLTGERTSFSGEFFRIEDALIHPAPDPPVPIVVGGRSPAALQRAGRLGDGWLAAWCSPRRFAAALSEVREHATAAGRTDVRWRHGLQVWVGLDEDRSRARERLAHEMQEMYRIPFEPFERYSPVGPPESVAAFLADYAAAGCRDFNVMAVAASPEQAVDGVAEIGERLRAGFEGD
jgi:alkanesulfonate monooxygenase SsuD/methylene tetrahydromethanopterin reductase-like flavin-dependent oxidoreductase (luciferase family)